MNIKSLLLGSAAALVAVSGARAADAVEVVAEPEPMEYVQICDTYGAGFYYIPGTQTCLKIGGYIRYQIGAGDRFSGTVSDTGDDTYRKKARAYLEFDARSDTEFGTLRGYAALGFDYDTNHGSTSLRVNANGTVTEIANHSAADSFFIDQAIIELGGFRVGKIDSMFATFTNYAGGVMDDGIVPFAPFSTHQISYTYTGENGFSAAIALEEGSAGDDSGTAIHDYVPHVVAGAAYKQAWGGLSAVAGYDSNVEEFSIKGRLDVNLSEQAALFVMAAYDTGLDAGAAHFRGNYYAPWGGDWAVWGGGQFNVTEKTSVRAQLSYDDDDNFGAVVGVRHFVVENFYVQPEVSYKDNFDNDNDDTWGAQLRFQRNF